MVLRMKPGRPSIMKLVTAGAMIAGLDVFWNLALGRIPIYLPPLLSPGAAIPLNALVHIGVTAAFFCLLGTLIFFLPGRWFKKHYAAGTVTAWGVFLGLTVLARYQNLQQEMSPTLVLLSRFALAAAIAAGALVLAKTVRRSPKAGWPVFLVISAFAATGILLLRYPLHPILSLLPFLGGIWLVHLLAGVILRRRRVGITVPSVGVAALAVLAAAAAGFRSGGGGDPSRPHLVFLVLDAARADRMSLYGYRGSTTPLLDSRAGNSLLFRQAYPTANYTFPSHVTFFTGLYNRTHDIWQGTEPEMERYRGFDNLACSLSRRGYRTLLLTENPWVAGLYGGFSHYHYLDIGGMPVSGWQGTWKDLSSTPSRFPLFLGNTPSPFAARQLLDCLIFSLQGYYKGLVDDYQLRLLYERMLLRRRDEPLFFFINWMNVHNRYYPAAGREFGKTIRPYDWSGDYDRAMAHVDRRIDGLWELFARTGELDRTVFLVASDHGELLGEYRVFGHTRSFFQGVIRVPLAFISSAWPGRRVAESPVSLVAVKPALELLADRRPGEDLRAELISVFADRPVVAEHRSFQPGPDGEYLRGWMLVSGDRAKLIRDPEAPGFQSTWGGTEDFLFDLESDPREEENLYSSRPRTVERLQGIYRDWREATPVAPALAEGRIAPGLKKRLRAMGYL